LASLVEVAIMSKSRLIITAVVVEGRSKSEVARDYDVSRYWVQLLVKRYNGEGEAAFTPRSRAPRSSPQAVSAELEEEIVRLRKELMRKGVDAGADTIRSHLVRRTPRSQTSNTTRLPAVSTIWRILTRRGFVTPQPQKRPRSSWRSFCAEQPNERWQADVTHWQLADGTHRLLRALDERAHTCRIFLWC
jgi:transposase